MGMWCTSQRLESAVSVGGGRSTGGTHVDERPADRRNGSLPLPPTSRSRQRTGAARADLRVDDAARREASEALGVHMAAGRLTLVEFEERLARVFAAVTESELAAVTADLPRTATTSSRARRRAAARSMVAGWLALCALFLTIWALTGADYFWPVWPMMGTGIGTLPGAWALWRGTDDPQAAQAR